MLGIFFTTVIKYIEKKYGLHVADQVITTSNLKSDGIYTRIGSYDASEIKRIIEKCSTITQSNPKTIMYEYGEYLFKIFLKVPKNPIHTITNFYEYILTIEKTYKNEILKLSPEDFTPFFTTIKHSRDGCILLYTCETRMPSAFNGFIKAIANHYNEAINIEVKYRDKRDIDIEFHIQTIT